MCAGGCRSDRLQVFSAAGGTEQVVLQRMCLALAAIAARSGPPSGTQLVDQALQLAAASAASSAQVQPCTAPLMSDLSCALEASCSPSCPNVYVCCLQHNTLPAPEVHGLATLTTKSCLCAQSVGLAMQLLTAIADESEVQLSRAARTAMLEALGERSGQVLHLLRAVLESFTGALLPQPCSRGCSRPGPCAGPQSAFTSWHCHDCLQGRSRRRSKPSAASVPG